MIYEKLSPKNEDADLIAGPGLLSRLCNVAGSKEPGT